MVKWKWLCIGIALLSLAAMGAYVALDPERQVLDERTRIRLGGTYIELADGVTHYQLAGPADGPVVVLVHGATVPMWTWDHLTASLAASGYRVLRYDKYGRGYSDRPAIDYNRGLYQRQLRELVDRLGLKTPFDLIGLSMGGATAVNFTAQYPERVRKLVLIAPVIHDFEVPAAFRIPVLGEFAARLVGIRFIVNRFADLLADIPDFDAYHRLFSEQTTYRGFQQSLLSMIRGDALGNYDDAYRAVGRQERDALLIWGTDDAEITKDMIDAVCTSIPRLQFRPVSGTGHGIVFQKPALVQQAILSFLERGKI